MRFIPSCKVTRATALVVMSSVGLMQSACSSMGVNLPGLSLPSVESLSSFENLQDRIYAGASFGESRLDPDLSRVALTLQNGSTLATQFKVGLDLHRYLGVELDTSVLGTANLEATAEADYSSFAASTLIYGLTGVANKSRREKLSAYGRLGYGYSSVSSNVTSLDERDLSGAVLGLGVEYGFQNGLGLRLEATRFHSEADLVSIGAIYRFGSPVKRRQPVFAAAEPAESIDIKQNFSTALADKTGNASRQILASASDTDADGVLNDLDQCSGTVSGTSVGSNGCGLFDGVIEGVTFATDSTDLNRSAKKILDALAARLIAFPEVRVSVQAHTDNKGPGKVNQSISQARAITAVRYLVSRGVVSDQLEATGMGELHPRSSNETEEGRLANKRLELVTRPNMELTANNRLVYNVPVRSKGKRKTTSSKPRLIKNTSSEPQLAAAQAGIAPLPEHGKAPGAELNGIIRGVSFAEGTKLLTENSFNSLDQFATQLKAFPSVRVAIMVHTDGEGDQQASLDLSMERAKEVADYLAVQGVEYGRFETEGYGDALPLVQSLTEQGVNEQNRALNRRVEARVLTN